MSLSLVRFFRKTPKNPPKTYCTQLNCIAYIQYQVKPCRRRLTALAWFYLFQSELEEAVRKGNEKFNTMITEQLMAREDMRRSAEADAKVIR